MNFNNGKKIFVVLQFQKKEKAPTCPVSALSQIGFFSYILHDKDTTENGEKKGLHAHLYLDAEKGMSSKNWIMILSAIFGITEDAISIEIASCPSKCIKYQLHALPQNVEDGKYQYQRNEIITNNDKKVDELFNFTEKAKFSDLTIEDFYACKDETELFKLVGANNFRNALFIWERLGISKAQSNATLKELTENMRKTHEYIHFLMQQSTTNAVEKQMLKNISQILSLGSFENW